MPIHTSLLLLRVALGGWALICLTSSLTSAQDRTRLAGEPSGETTARKEITTLISPSISLEGVIDPTQYRLGPGDRLEFDVWGSIEEQHELVVAPDGRIGVPGVGELVVAGLTVATADSLSRVAAHQSYPHADTNLRLIGVRMMKAIVSGAVAFPGVYEVAAVDRLTTLIERAGGLLTPAEEVREEGVAVALPTRPQSSLRHLTISSRAGAVREVDLLRFYTTGNLGYNPVLSDGDAVHVPLVSRETGVVTIFGAVKNPQEFEFVAGDRLRDLVALAGGFRDHALVSDVTIVRFGPDERSHSELQADLSDALQPGPYLAPDDRIFVRRQPDYRRKYHVSITGEVRFPGTCPIEKDNTRLTDVVAACGGLTDRANLYSARVIRRSMAGIEDPEFARLKVMSVADMSDMEYEYFKSRSREGIPPVVVNFRKLFLEGDKSQDIVLQGGDEILIPTQSPTVKVVGQVNSPGLIRYAVGEGYEYYIRKAEGYSWNARKGKLRLIKAHSGMSVKPNKSTPVEIGDAIFVPEKRDTDWWGLSKDLLLAASQAATVVILIRSVR